MGELYNNLAEEGLAIKQLKQEIEIEKLEILLLERKGQAVPSERIDRLTAVRSVARLKYGEAFTYMEG